MLLAGGAAEHRCAKALAVAAEAAPVAGGAVGVGGARALRAVDPSPSGAAYAFARRLA